MSLALSECACQGRGDLAAMPRTFVVLVRSRASSIPRDEQCASWMLDRDEFKTFHWSFESITPTQSSMHAFSQLARHSSCLNKAFQVQSNNGMTIEGCS